jgi:DNA-binding beta-propeller fold protein YncE
VRSCCDAQPDQTQPCLETHAMITERPAYTRLIFHCLAAVSFCAATMVGLSGCTSSASYLASEQAPAFRVDTSWPNPLPNNWILGQVSGVAVDANDHVWVLQRPRSLSEDEAGAALNPPQSKCCVAAPPVIEFDATGRVLRTWGGTGQGYDWPGNEHGIHIDGKGFVWITGNGDKDGQVLKFTPDGKFVLQIGKVGPQSDSADTTRLGKAAGVEVDVAANEIYVADGYHNRRVIVFDAETGAYKRHWGAYGKPPSDADKPEARRPAPPNSAQLAQFGTPVHCVRVAQDGLVYVCDRLNNRIQVFQKDGRYVKEFMVEPRTAGNGSVWDVVISRDAQQKWLFLADGRNNQVLTIDRHTGAVVGTLGRPGRYAGEFHWVHDLAIDSKGNLFAGEVDNGKRVQKFSRVR